MTTTKRIQKTKPAPKERVNKVKVTAKIDTHREQNRSEKVKAETDAMLDDIDEALQGVETSLATHYLQEGGQ